MAHPWILIPCGSATREDRVSVYGVNAEYVQSVQRAGGRVVLVPPGDLEAANDLLRRSQGLLLTGGPDVDPGRYGQPAHPGLGSLDPARDELDTGLLQAALDGGKPIFGICRGQQVINVALGGTLFQDLPTEHPSEVQHRTAAKLGREYLAHSIEVAPGSRLAAIVAAQRLDVNSFHHQAVKDVAAGLRVSATSPDGIVEGLETSDGQIVAVQCHPEELANIHGWAAALFEDFVQRAAG